MALDRISEEIAHFVGMFHLEIEAAKLRLDYLAFRTEMDGPELDPLKEDRFAGRDEIALRDLKTRSDRPDTAPPTATPAAPKMAYVPWQGAERAVSPEPQPEITIDTPAPLAAGSLALGGQMIEILPNSIVLAIEQTAFLTDDDLLIFDGSASFTDPAVYLTLLHDLAELAQTLHLIAPWAWSPADGSIMDAAKQMATAMTEAEPPEVEGLSAVILRGDEAEGSFVNGLRVDDVPLIEDLLPDFLQRKADEAEAKAEATLVKSDGVTDHDPGPFAVDPGHHVVTGGNRVINETVLKSVWVDAPVIAVAQDVLRLDVISQVNMRIASSDLPGPAQAAPSHALNIARLEQTSASAGDAEAGQSGSGSAEGLPSIWNVTRLEGDLLLMNWVQQHIFTTDYDRVEVQFTGAATYIGTGENLVFNETLILNLGFHYDLILIGGNMLTLNQITQVNVLLDQDSITGDVPDGATLHAGDNLQVNTAAIMTTGTDSLTEKTDMFSQALSDLAGGAKTIPAGLAQDALFAGNDALNVLYISGDLIQTNVIEQTNYLGDSDQIHFIKDMFATAEGAEVTVTSGSNAQINAASIVAEGLDSTVMAGGETYSDALIYQAELIDDCAPPAGVQMDKLATEAVAFLADDMIGPAPVDDCGPAVQVDDCPGAVDVMQTMLA
ncbi:MAG: hypothetical protein LPJ92_11395 [Rhodobacterales bacterium]|nr:hypothetical protein [Rhodobacterales bacterium]MDX5390938.1 hypothetical protein [Rhodobacterales bacterium]MDX5490633.1 hypothetical protein [Rhodobacterales bacterium]